MHGKEGDNAGQELWSDHILAGSCRLSHEQILIPEFARLDDKLR